MRSDRESLLHRGRRLDQDMQGQRPGACALQSALGGKHVVHRFALGKHHMAQPMPSLAGNGGYVTGKRRMVHRMHPRRYAGFGRCTAHELRHERRVFRFSPDGGTVFAVQRHIKNADAELGGHCGLQLQAFLHPIGRATVVIAHRNGRCSGLRPLQNVARMLHLPVRFTEDERRRLARRSVP